MIATLGSLSREGVGRGEPDGTSAILMGGPVKRSDGRTGELLSFVRIMPKIQRCTLKHFAKPLGLGF